MISSVLCCRTVILLLICLNATDDVVRISARVISTRNSGSLRSILIEIIEQRFAYAIYANTGVSGQS